MTIEQNAKIAEFVSRAEHADEFCAMRYLQENDWEVEAALMAYDADEE